jgi:subfamily B ATP-binding cassette protein MsbA
LGIRIIKAFTAESKAKARFEKENNNYTFIMNKVQWKKALAHPISELMGTIVIVLIMWYGGGMVLNNSSTLSPQEFITFIIIFFQILTPAKSLSNLYFDINKGMAAFERVREVLIADESIRDVPNAKIVEKFEQGIEYDNVTFSYDDKAEVLKDINLTIKKGQSVALVGQSGAGKSTLVDLLPRFFDITKGAIRVDGIPIKELQIKSLRNLIGVVNQEQILFNDTIFNNIAFGVDEATEE